MLGVAVIGLGYWGPNLVRNISASDRTELVRICDLDPSRLESIGSSYPAAARSKDTQEVFDDPDVDAVCIATPVSTHHEIARRALEHGKHALVEKPFTTTQDEADELIEVAGRNDLLLLVDHVFLYSPAVKKLQEVVASGDVGDLLFIDSVRINLGMFQHDVNVLWDLAPHDLSIIDSLVGREPENVVAVGASHARDRLANVAYLHLDYGDDLLASVHVNWLSPVKLRHFMIGGSRRSILYNDLDPSEPVKIYDRGIDVDEHPEDRRKVLISYRSGDVVSPRVDREEPLRNVVEHLADCLENGATPVSPAEQGRRLVRILQAADRSLSAGGAQIAPGTV